MNGSTLTIRLEDETPPPRADGPGVPASAPSAAGASSQSAAVAAAPPLPPRPDAQADSLVRAIRESVQLTAAREVQLRAEIAQVRLDGPKIMELLDRFTRGGGGGGGDGGGGAGVGTGGDEPPRRPLGRAEPVNIPRAVAQSARVRGSLQRQQEAEAEADKAEQEAAVSKAARVRQSLQRQRQREEEADQAEQAAGVDRAARIRASLQRQRQREEDAEQAEKEAAVEKAARVRAALARQRAREEEQERAEQQANVSRAARIRQSLQNQREREEGGRARVADQAEQAFQRMFERREQWDAAARESRERMREITARTRESDAQLRVQNLSQGVRAVIDPGGSLASRFSGVQQTAASGALGEGAAQSLGGAAGAKGTAALAAVEAVNQVPAALGRAVREGIAGLGEFGKRAAVNDGFGAVERASEGAANALEKFRLEGKIAAEAIRTVSAAVRATKGTIDAVADRGKQLAAYDPRIALAAGEVEVRKLRMEVMDAQRFGSQYASAVRGQQSLEEIGVRLFEPFKVKAFAFVDRAIPVLETGAVLLEAVVKKLDEGADGAGKVIDQLGPILGAIPGLGGIAGIFGPFKDLAEEMRKNNKLDKDIAQNKQDLMLKEALWAVENLQGVAQVVDPALIGADRQLRLPFAQE